MMEKLFNKLHKKFINWCKQVVEKNGYIIVPRPYVNYIMTFKCSSPQKCKKIPCNTCFIKGYFGHLIKIADKRV